MTSTVTTFDETTSAAIAVLFQKILDCRSDNEKCKRDYTTLQNRLTILENQNTSLANRVVVLENEKRNLKRRIEGLEDDVEVLDQDKNKKKRRRLRKRSSTST